MEVIKADMSHRKFIIDLYDEFLYVCNKIINGEGKREKRKEYKNNVLDRFLLSDDTAIFLAKNSDVYVGILSIHKIPILRRGIYDAEIEEMFVQESLQGTGVSRKLLQTAEIWAKQNQVRSIQLKSHNFLERAHSFYRKNGFTDYGKSFEKKL